MYWHDQGLQDFTADVDDETKEDCHVQNTSFGRVDNPIEEQRQEEEDKEMLQLIMHDVFRMRSKSAVDRVSQLNRAGERNTDMQRSVGLYFPISRSHLLERGSYTPKMPRTYHRMGILSGTVGGLYPGFAPATRNGTWRPISRETKYF